MSTLAEPSRKASTLDVHFYTWMITVVVMVTILAIDVLVIGRRPHEPSM